ncbi:NAD(P)-dependent alcohol dehydrogenase [Thalassococcus sp. CAU 1522]|uniref:NAD(P)-dependent alcohol dehydrogenase n=1 Tax=Thalassococcus arenae TaxID=2851652 RepID=A0ABS6N6E0_9RHOB|nr:NAD(P)-dependent alcohol dehydrogenase [Thalassococcus arenae]MBV2359584.1 NAD(P)-dependent alcohol dehydrogenase [Thalassococcus arenae]
MKAAIYTRYGAPQSVSVKDVATPAPAPDQILIRVRASTVTTADWRLRASAFPGLLWLPGRLMTGLVAPKNPILGLEVAGEIVATGRDVTRFHIGQRVFGFTGGGAHAEYLALSQDAAVLPIPTGMSDAEAAALPWGAVAALVFLRDVARVKPGQDVLIVGASGGVGVYAVQIAKAMGATVTGVCSAANVDLVRDLGADTVLDYRKTDIRAARNAYDLVFDTVGATRYPKMIGALRKNGLFLPLNFGGRELWHLVLSRLIRGPRIKLFVNGDSAEDLRAVLAMVANGQLRPVVDRHFALDDIVSAHAYVEARHRKGAVIVDMARAGDARAIA